VDASADGDLQREADAAEHRGILGAVAAGDPDAAAALMDRHVAAPHEHWAREVAAERETEEVSA
jgi:DNA-binding FadR family transcriptional regulator